MKDKARTHELKNQVDKAIETYLSIIEELEGEPELEDELALFNKVGDLYIKVGNVAAAVDMYERAVAKYAEGGFHNNAIALCNKVLRNAPSRTHVYLRLAQLMVQRGFIAEAKQNLLEYADRMKGAGKLDEAFRALKEFADLSPNSEEIRLVLAEQLKAAARTDEAREQLAKLYHEAQATGDPRRSRATIEKMRAIDPEYDVESAPKPKVKPKQEKSSDLVFLDLGDEPTAAPPARPAPAAAPPSPKPAPKAAPKVTAPPPKPRPAPEPEPEPEPLAFEPTSLADAEEPDVSVEEDLPEEALPVERASLEFDATGVSAGTMEGLTGTGLDAPADVPPVSDFEPTIVEAAPTGADEAEDVGGDLPLIVPEEREEIELELPGRAAAAEPVELPLLEVEMESDLPALEPVMVGDDVGFEVPELDLGESEDAAAESMGPLGGLDLEIEMPAIEEIAGPSDVAALEAAVAEDPDDPTRHQRLGEALIETGQRERGMEELDIALSTYEARDDWHQAEDMADEILRLDPNSVRHYQKRVEYAFRRGDKGHLVDAYLELSDGLFRSGAMERARAVYQRVIELDPANERARSALATLEPEVSAPAQKPAKPAAPTGDFIDLGALMVDEVERPKDARMRIEDEEPTGDEQRDFDEMLVQFKKGIEASLGVEDVQAHYDLGVAFKEMGLLDEAISEFQKSLRGAEGRLRTSEALGTCFFEKGQYSVAVTVLRRAIETDPSDDEAKIGLLYWGGRCEEELGRKAEALAYYQRVFAVDIGFQDVRDRVKDLAKARG